MQRPLHARFRWLTAGLIVCLAASADVTRATEQAQAPPSVIVQVRAALAHGDVAAARQLAVQAAGAGAATAADGETGLALVEMFVGQFDEARQRLEPIAQADPLGEAALELGLLEQRLGLRDQGYARLLPLSGVRTLNTPDDYYRLARAAEGVGEYLLANDAYNRVLDVPRADIFATSGDMFLLRHRNDFAGDAYRDALEADPQWIPAHIGLARALVNEDREASAAGLAAARDIADDHPDVLMFSAELALINEDIDEAKSRLDRLATVRPGTVDEAALRVAIAYEEGGVPAAEAALPAVAEANPTSALGFRRAGEQAASDFRFDIAADFARRGTLHDPADAFAYFDLGLYLLRTGDEAEARTALERSFELDNSGRVTENLLDLLDTLDTFVTVDVDNMVFKFHPGEAAVLRPYAIPLAQQAYREFSERYGFTPPDPILIEIFPRHDDFAVRTLGLPGLTFALGACFGRVVTMDSPQARPPGQFSWQATLWHELAHAFTLQVSDYRVPRWLTEGISVYEEHRRVPAWGRELTLSFAQRLSAGDTFGVAGLPNAFKQPQDMAMAYFEASLVVEHLVEANGEAGLRTLLQAYADGATDEDAFERAFGQSVDTVEASFAEFVDARYGDLSRAMARVGSVDPDDVTALKMRASAEPGSFVSQLELGQALYLAGALDAARPVLERAASLAPPASGPNSPRDLLARIAAQQGDQAAARRHLRELLTYDHANVGAARGLRDLSADSPDDLDVALRLIADLSPMDPDVHGQLGRRLMAQSEYAEALVEFRAALAVGPPNLAEAHTDMAEALLRLDRRDEAKAAALAALVEAPTFARAQDVLLEAIGRD